MKYIITINSQEMISDNFDRIFFFYPDGVKGVLTLMLLKYNHTEEPQESNFESAYVDVLESLDKWLEIVQQNNPSFKLSSHVCDAIQLAYENLDSQLYFEMRDMFGENHFFIETAEQISDRKSTNVKDKKCGQIDFSITINFDQRIPYTVDKSVYDF